MENNELLLQILENTKQLDVKLDIIEKIYDERFENIEKRLDNFEQHLDNFDKVYAERFDSFEQHLRRIEKKHGERLTKYCYSYGKRTWR